MLPRCGHHARSHCSRESMGAGCIRAEPVVRAGYEGGAGQSRSRRLAAHQPNVQSASFQPTQPDQQSNVAQLRMAWSRGLPAGAQESTPIVYRGVMYVMAPGASIQALDATNGDLIWEYGRNYPPASWTAAARSKSLGIYEDMIYFGAPDGFLVALDAQTGKLRWETKVDDGQITAGGLLVADGKVISNRTCQQGKREYCFIAAHDAKTGKEVWKFYVTAAPGEPGGDTWGNVPVEQRAAGPWGLPGSYDPVRKVVYWGVANPNPYTRFKRHGSYDAIAPTSPASSTATRPSRSTSRPASWSGTSRNCPATTGTPTTTRSAC